MTIKNFKILCIFIAAGFCGFTATARLPSGVLQQYLLQNLNDEPGINYKERIQEFYARIHYQTTWLLPKTTTNLSCLIDNLPSASVWGLNEKDYQYNFVSAFKDGKLRLENQTDSLKAEVLFSDAAIHFY